MLLCALAAVSGATLGLLAGGLLGSPRVEEAEFRYEVLAAALQELLTRHAQAAEGQGRFELAPDDLRFLAGVFQAVEDCLPHQS